MATPCSFCGQSSADPDFCSECGAEIARIVGSPPAPDSPRLTAAPASVTGAAAAGAATDLNSGRSHSSGIIVNSARPGAALSVVQRRFGSGRTSGSGTLSYSERATERPCFRCGAMMGKHANFCRHCGAQRDHLLKDRYRFAGIVGGGGMGGVLGVEDMNLVDEATGHGRLLVAKFALPNPDPDLAEQARRERQFLVRIDHPRLVKVLDLLSMESKDWIVMELVPGEDLASLSRDLGQAISVQDALGYAIQICEALGYLHALQPPLVYRDLKPDNVMLMPTGDIKLIDLGGAKVLDRHDAKDEIAIGTRGFYAPEAEHGLTDERSDLYALGRTLLALVIGPNWQPESLKFGVPERIGYPVLRKYAMLHDLLERACAERPEDRYQNAAELADDLRTVLRAIAGAAAGVVTTCARCCARSPARPRAW